MPPKRRAKRATMGATGEGRATPDGAAGASIIYEDPRMAFSHLAVHSSNSVLNYWSRLQPDSALSGDQCMSVFLFFSFTSNFIMLRFLTVLVFSIEGNNPEEMIDSRFYLSLTWRLAKKDQGLWKKLPIPEALYEKPETSAAGTSSGGDATADKDKTKIIPEASSKTIIGVKGGHAYTPINLLPYALFKEIDVLVGTGQHKLPNNSELFDLKEMIRVLQTEHVVGYGDMIRTTSFLYPDGPENYNQRNPLISEPPASMNKGLRTRWQLTAGSAEVNSIIRLGVDSLNCTSYIPPLVPIRLILQKNNPNRLIWMLKGQDVPVSAEEESSQIDIEIVKAELIVRKIRLNLDSLLALHQRLTTQRYRTFFLRHYIQKVSGSYLR